MNTFAIFQIPFISADDLRWMVFPAALFIYYFICWLLMGKDPKIENVAPQYEAPPGITPGVARYVMTGGSDGTTLAAILASLASKGVISIQPTQGCYRITLLNDKNKVMPEEASTLKNLLGVGLPVEPYAATNTAKMVDTRARQKKHHADAFGDDVLEATMGTPAPHVPGVGCETMIDPRAQVAIKSVLDAIQGTFRENLQGIYFRWNFAFVFAGMIATFAWALAVAYRLETPQGSALFLTFWLLFFTSVAGAVIAGVWSSKPAHPTAVQRIQNAMLPVVFFLLPGFVIYQFALPTAHAFVLALLISVALNNIFFILMRAPTREGRRVLQQLAGFREFLVRVEQDRLDRVNTSAEKAAIMDRFLPYAIALNVREGWGDAMAATFSNAIVER